MLIGIITANRVLVTLQFRGKLSTPLPCLSGEGKDFVHLAASQHRFLGLVRGPGCVGGAVKKYSGLTCPGPAAGPPLHSALLREGCGGGGAAMKLVLFDPPKLD